MRAYDYTIEEIRVETGHSKEEVQRVEESLFTKMSVETMAGLMRVAYEHKILVLYECD